jgi:2-polyprenyl-6-methoxyphenol hydroxylase-like FAD-dependent oxidoreductase
VLAGATDAAAALRRYEELRRPRTTELLLLARRMNRLLGMRGPGARLRDAVMRVVPQAIATRMLARQFGFDHLRG